MLSLRLRSRLGIQQVSPKESGEGLTERVFCQLNRKDLFAFDIYRLVFDFGIPLFDFTCNFHF